MCIYIVNEFFARVIKLVLNNMRVKRKSVREYNVNDGYSKNITIDETVSIIPKYTYTAEYYLQNKYILGALTV